MQSIAEQKFREAVNKLRKEGGTCRLCMNKASHVGVYQPEEPMRSILKVPNDKIRVITYLLCHRHHKTDGIGAEVEQSIKDQYLVGHSTPDSHDFDKGNLPQSKNLSSFTRSTIKAIQVKSLGPNTRQGARLKAYCKNYSATVELDPEKKTIDQVIQVVNMLCEHMKDPRYLGSKVMAELSNGQFSVIFTDEATAL